MLRKRFDHLETNIQFMNPISPIHEIGPNFLWTIRTLYNRPQTHLAINGLSLNDFTLTWGTRQGCPVFPLLFPLSMEPLVEAIHCNRYIAGVTIGQHHHVISLFMDDTVIYVTNAAASLPHLMPLLSDFGKVSVFAINLTKTELYPIGLSETQRAEIQAKYNFKWVNKSWRHLGILIPLHLNDLFDVNYKPLFNKVRSTMHNWSTKWLNWIEHIELVKTNIFSSCFNHSL